MRNSLVLCAVMLGWGLAFPGVADAKPSVPITDVLLYPGGATIVRTVHVSPGMKQAVITGLPSSFDMQTLHAEASEGVHIGEIVSADAANTQAANPAEAALEAKITALRDREAELDAEAKSAQMVIDYLTRMMAAEGAQDDARRRFAPPLDARTLAGVAGAMRSEAGKSLARIQAIAVQKRELFRKIDALQRDLARLHSGERDTRTLTINLAAARAGTVNVSYQVSNAGWKPSYRASLNSETSKVDLEREAIISQKTGEDWSNVHLTLSTSAPQQATSSADPVPWLLAFVQRLQSRAALMMEAPMSAPAPAVAMAKRKANALADEAAGKEEEETEADDYAPPTFETQGMFSNTYEVPARTSLPADGREVSVKLAKQEIAVKQYFQTVPRREPGVYVTAEADMPQGDWPRGNIQLFRNGSYVGGGWWNPQARDRFVLGFGRDDQIHVSTVPLKTDSASSGILEKRRQQKTATMFVIVNRHQRPVDLKVLEASPVATSEEISVHTAFTPKPSQENWEDKRGVMSWDVTLAPGGTTKIKTEYEISYPLEGVLSAQ